MPEEKQTEIVEETKSTETGDDQQPAGDDGETLESTKAELAETRKALKKANQEAAQRRKKLESLEKADQERQEAELSEIEKLQKQNADHEAEIERIQNEARQVRVKSAVIALASEMGFQDPNDAYKLLDLSDVEVDGKGNVEGIKEPLEKLKESKPYMIKKAKTVIQGAATNPGENVSSTGETEDQRRARLYGTSGPNLFTTEGAKKHGGGVIEIEK